MMRVNGEFIRQLRQAGDFNATVCIHCGTCTALCPHGLDILPRQLFRYVVLGLEDQVLANKETIFSCLLCKLCEVNCPGDVNITGNIRTIRNYIHKKVHGF